MPNNICVFCHESGYIYIICINCINNIYNHLDWTNIKCCEEREDSECIYCKQRGSWMTKVILCHNHYSS